MYGKACLAGGFPHRERDRTALTGPVDFDSDPDIDLDPPDIMFIRGVDLMSAMTV